MLRYVRLLGLLSGLGPLFDLPGGKPTGDPAPAPNPPPDGGAGGAGGSGQPPAGPTGQPPADDRSSWIPRTRFDEVAEENRRLKAAEEQRQTDEAKRKGDFETLSKKNEDKASAAEQKALRIGRRAAFIAKASGKVGDPEAAYKLAAADGKLDDVEIDDDGNAKDPKKVEAIVAELLKTYEFLKPTGQSSDFGDSRNGQPGAPPPDPSKMGSREMLRAGYAQSGSSGFRNRQS